MGFFFLSRHFPAPLVMTNARNDAMVLGPSVIMSLCWEMMVMAECETLGRWIA